MYFYGALIILVVIVGLIIYNEIRKNKRYEKERQERLKRQKKPKDTLKVRVKPKEETTPKTPLTPKIQPEVKEQPKIDTTPTPKTEPSVELPECNFPDFDHSRLMDMGLGEDDAKEFVGDLINQIDEQIPKIQNAIDEQDVKQVERLTHSIKGSSTNIGVGGVADLLVEFNTYTKNKANFTIIKEYFQQLKIYLQKLKDQYS
jgi:HPt (histidine-containing phosphotransfer) domain-containing protein